MLREGTVVTLSASSEFLGKSNNPKSTSEKGTIIEFTDENGFQVLWETGARNYYQEVDLVEEGIVLSTDGFKWIESKGQFIFDDATPPTTHDVLPSGIYTPVLNAAGNIVGLQLIRREFSFNYKIYDLDKPFIDRVIKTFSSINNNLGILLNGVKGTGKSVTAKMICNKLDVPVILIERKPNNLGPYLNNFKQDVCVLVDEFEKVYDISTNRNNQDSLLTAMDGVHNNEFKKVFILTSNSSRVNENLIDRPTRIRYMKEYGNLTIDVITEIVSDLIENKELLRATIAFISTLQLITVDIIKNVVSEVNIHNESPEAFKDLFNVSYSKPNIVFTIYEKDKATLKHTLVRSSANSVLNALFVKELDVYTNYSFTEERVAYVGTRDIEYIGEPDKDGFYSLYDDNNPDDEIKLRGYCTVEIEPSVNEAFKSYVF